MKIGILIADFERLQNFELRIIQGIIDDPSLELSLLIKDDRKPEEVNVNLWSKLKRFAKLKNSFALLILKVQLLIEARLFKVRPSINKSKIVAYLNSIPSLEVSPISKGFLDIFNKEQADRIKDYDLDIILRHEFRIIRGDILFAAKYGIWSFHHADNDINRGGPPCFWEVALKQPVIGVTLQQLTPELDGGLIIDKAYFDRDFSFYKSHENIVENSVALLFKNIKKLQLGKLSLTKSQTYYNPLYRSPSLKYVMKYNMAFYSKIVSIIKYRLLYIFGGYKENCWTLFLGKGNFMESALYKLKPAKLPKNEFWADPFLFRHDDDVYIFFERYDYKLKKAGISCGKIVDKEITEIQNILDLDYHLSYPYIFEEDGEVYMIPETSQAHRVEVYICKEFPAKWELYATAFEGEDISDVIYYKDESGQRWLFFSKGYSDMNNELHIFAVDSPRLENIQAHQMNPVLIDSRVARNAGALFRYDGHICRPSQNCINNVYGYGLNINRINKLTLDDYEEERLITIQPHFKKGLSGVHHLHQIDGMFVIDGCFKRYKS